MRIGRRTLRALAVCALLGLALSACGGGAKPAATAGSAPPAGQIGDDKSKDAAGKKPSSGAGSKATKGSTSGAKKGGPGTLPAASVPAGVKIPAAGLYVYEGTASFNVGGAPQEQAFSTKMTLAAPHNTSNGVEQKQAMDAGQYRATNMLGWRSDGQYMVWTETSDGKRCTFQPAMRVIRFPLAVGTRWSVGETKCKEGGTPSSGGITTAQGAAMKVIKAESIRIGGTSVRTFVIESKSSTQDGSAESQQTIKQWFAPAYGLTVKMDMVTTGTYSGRIEITLKSLRPA